MDIASTLTERETTHGDFADVARIAQQLRDVYRTSPGWSALAPVMRESLDMDASKVARILCGDPFHKDHWIDRCGYAALVEGKLP